MPEGAPVDAYLRFCHDPGGKTWEGVIGESTDKQCSGDPANRKDPKNPGAPDTEGWFPITSYRFTLGGTSAQGGGHGAAPAKGGAAPAPAPGKASGKQSAEGIFQGVEVTMRTQFGSIKLMKLCTDFAIKNAQQSEIMKIDMAYIFVRRPGYEDQFDAHDTGQNWFLSIWLKGVTIASYTHSITQEDTFTLNYEKMKVWYFPTDLRTGKFYVPYLDCSQWWMNSAEKSDNETFDSR